MPILTSSSRHQASGQYRRRAAVGQPVSRNSVVALISSPAWGVRVKLLAWIFCLDRGITRSACREAVAGDRAEFFPRLQATKRHFDAGVRVSMSRPRLM